MAWHWFLKCSLCQNEKTKAQGLSREHKLDELGRNIHSCLGLLGCALCFLCISCFPHCVVLKTHQRIMRDVVPQQVHVDRHDQVRILEHLLRGSPQAKWLWRLQYGAHELWSHIDWCVLEEKFHRCIIVYGVITNRTGLWGRFFHSSQWLLMLWLCCQ